MASDHTTKWAVWWWSHPPTGVEGNWVWRRDCAGGARPALFHTRRYAQKWIRDNYGYIAHRNDLRSAPHYWRVPKAIRVDVVMKEHPRD